MHNKCFVAVDHRCICTDATAVVTDECVPPLKKADPVLLEVTATVAQNEIQPIVKTRLSWQVQDEVLRSSIAALREVEYEQEVMLAASYTVGMLLYMVENEAKKTMVNKPGSTVVVSKVQEGLNDVFEVSK